MKLLLATVLFSVLLVSCTKNYNNKIEGSYTGTFHRYYDPLSNPPNSNVTINFTEKEFSGTSNMAKYPAIGNGTYAATANKLNVKNKSFFTADFDWTLIFDGSYNYKFDGDKLQIWKEYPFGMKDIYLLQRVK